jgi:hypothetical protein
MTIFPLDGERSWVSNIKLELFGQTTGKISEKKTDRRGQTWFQDVPAGEGYRVQVQKPLALLDFLVKKFSQITDDWKTSEEIFAYGYRGNTARDKVEKPSLNSINKNITIAKRIILAEQTMAIQIQLEEQDNDKQKEKREFIVLVSLKPLITEYIPENIKLEIGQETGEPDYVTAKTKDDCLKLGWSFEEGEHFYVKVQLNNISITENFVCDFSSEEYN